MIKMIELASGAMRRQMYSFNCKICLKDRKTVYKKFADRGICRACRTKEINKNQLDLFENSQNLTKNE
jgi:hypothetical protein